MEFARFEGTSDGGLPTALNLIPAHLVEVSREGDQTLIVMSAGQTHRVSYTEAEVIAEFRRAAEADREPDDEGPYRMKLDGSHRARGTYYPGLKDEVTNLGVWSGPLPPLCAHTAAEHIDDECAAAGCACMGWPEISGWHADADTATAKHAAVCRCPAHLHTRTTGQCTTVDCACPGWPGPFYRGFGDDPSLPYPPDDALAPAVSPHA